MSESQPPWRVKFQVTVDDYVNWMAFAMKHDAGLRDHARRGTVQFRATLFWLSGSLLAAVFFEYLSWRDTGGVSLAGAAGIVVIASLLWMITKHSRASQLTPAYLASIRRMTEAGGGYPRIHIITLTDSGLVDESERGRWEYYWSHSLESVAVTPDYLFIYCISGGAYMIARGAFAGTGVAPDEFAAEIRRRVQAAGGPESAHALREYLATRDVPCPDCGYNLRDLVFPRCPECGLQITLATLPGLQATPLK